MINLVDKGMVRVDVLYVIRKEDIPEFVKVVNPFCDNIKYNKAKGWKRQLLILMNRINEKRDTLANIYVQLRKRGYIGSYNTFVRDVTTLSTCGMVHLSNERGKKIGGKDRLCMEVVDEKKINLLVEGLKNDTNNVDRKKRKNTL